MKNKNKRHKQYEESSEFDHIQPVEAKPLEVKVYGNFERALKAFRALVQKERILSIYKEKQSYEKPSDKKRRKKNEMKRKMMELNAPTDVKKNSKKKDSEDRVTKSRD